MAATASIGLKGRGQFEGKVIVITGGARGARGEE